MIEHQSCADKVEESLRRRMETLKRFIENGNPREYLYTDDGIEIGCFDHYHLEFSYVEKWTFNEQPLAFWRYLISTGGPQEEIRYIMDDDGEMMEIQYWYLDWWDGAHIILDGEDENIAEEVYNYFMYANPQQRTPTSHSDTKDVRDDMMIP